MSTTQTPIRTMFEMQRSAMTQSQQAFKQAIDVQKQATDTFVRGFEQSERAREQTTGVTKAAVDMYFDAMVASVPGDAEGIEQLRANVHEQVDAAEEMQAQSWENVHGMLEQAAEAADEFADDYASMVDDGFEAAMQATEYVEGQSVAAAETVEEQFEGA